MNSTFIDALRGRAHGSIPVWYMRQAGRHMPGFAKYISQSSLQKIIRDPIISSEIAVEAVDMLNVDAAIVFSDIVTPLEEAGLEYNYERNAGPALKTFISLEELERNVLSVNDKKLWFITDQISEIKQKANVPIIGFAGAPFTLASYIIEGKYEREFPKTKSFMITRNWGTLLNAVIDLITSYVNVQINAGVSAIQLFDTWVGVLSEEQFNRYYLPDLAKLVSHIKARVPVIYFCADCSHLVTKISKSVKPTFMSIDWKVPIKSLYSAEKIGVQGNLDPVYSLIGGETMLIEAGQVLKDAEGIDSYIFNLGHGVIPGTDWKELKKLTEFVHSRH